MFTRHSTTVLGSIGWLLLAGAAGCQSTHVSSGGCVRGDCGLGRRVPGADGYEQVQKYIVPTPDPSLQYSPYGIPPGAIVSSPSAGYGHHEPGRDAGTDRSAAAPRRAFPVLRALPMPLNRKRLKSFRPARISALKSQKPIVVPDKPSMPGSPVSAVPSGPQLVPDMADTGNNGIRLRPFQMLPKQPLTEPLETQQKLVPGLPSGPKVLQDLNKNIRRLFRRTGQSKSRRRMSARRNQFQTTQASPKTETHRVFGIPLSGPIGRLVSFDQEDAVPSEPTTTARNPVKLGLPDFDDNEEDRSGQP